jgi:CheY-like chemotaxis protein
MQDLGGALAAPSAPVVIYTAKEIVTLDPARPSVAAVAVAGDRILAIGSLDQVRTALGRRPFRLDATFADQVIVPGLIAQHDHPLIAGLMLGLSIVERIGRVLDHPITLRSQPARGSVFAVTVPIAAPLPAMASQRATAPRPSAPLSGMAVLCIDNETEILDGMQTLLQRWGLRVLRASNAEEARSVFTQCSPDVVLADYHLGDGSCDGLELLQSLRVGGVAHAPAALVTADHGAEVAERARALGYKVLRKPVKPAALRGLLGGLLAAAGTERRR